MHIEPVVCDLTFGHVSETQECWDHVNLNTLKACICVYTDKLLSVDTMWDVG